MFGAYPVASDDRVQPRAVRRQRRAILRRVPQMQHAGRKRAVLASNTGMQEPDQQIRILQAPAAERAVKSVDAIEVAAPDREIAGARALPSSAAQLAQRAERQPQ